MLNVVFHEKYLNYDFGSNHPFWPDRAGRFLKKLEQSDLEYQILEPHRGKDEDILLAHTEDYLAEVKRLAREGGYISVDTPINERILESAYLSVGGSIIATQKALKGEHAMNLLGGLHHAERDSSSGFCVFNDHAVAIKKLQKEDRIEKALILDLDVHAGNGTQDIFYDDPSVFTISFHQNPATLYPGTCFPNEQGIGEGLGYNMNIVFEPGTGEDKYLKQLDFILAKDKIKNFNQDLTVLVLGVDTYKDDPLAALNMNKSFYRKVGERVRTFDNLAVMCAGGYSGEVPGLWLKFLYGLNL